MSAQTRRHYATTLLAMLKRAKAERVIKSHQLEGFILLPAPRNGDPQPWMRKELCTERPKCSTRPTIE